MRRKQTKLENNLYELGYKLDHKSYCGKKSEKVDVYVYLKGKGDISFIVSLDRTREKIMHYAFFDRSIINYTEYSIMGLKETFDNFKEELSEIYDFENQIAKDYQKIELADIENPFIEESNFDD